jgi:hypothetical protein
MDYARGDVVDITQVLNVAAGTNVLGGGYVRVTTSGLVQVDVTGGGNSWVTLSTINSTNSVDIRYLSGGAVATLTVSAVAASTSQAQSLDATMSGWDGGGGRGHGVGGAPIVDVMAMELLAFHDEPIGLF